MDAVSAYSFGSAAWLGIQAIPLIIWPTFISSILRTDYQQIDYVEQYFARSLGFSQLTVGLLLVVLTGALPLTSVADASSDTPSPYATAAVLISMFYHTSAAFYGYGRFSGTGQTGYVLGFLGSSVFAGFGLWVLMFGGDKGHISKRTGADKRTSGFPFKNAEADKRKPKRL